MSWFARDLGVPERWFGRAIPLSLVAVLVGFVACVLATVLYQ